MPKKYIYRHYYQGKEVSKNDFLYRLQLIFTKVVGNSDNPLLNIEVADLKKVEEKYALMKRSGYIYIYEYGSFQIKREEIQ